MKTRRTPGGRRRGSVLVEMLISALLSVIIGSALFALVKANYMAQSVALGQNVADSTARRPLDVVADYVRNAQVYGATSPSCISAATASSITVYTNTSGSTAKLWVDTSTSPYTLTKTVGTTSSALLTGIQSLTLTYYVSGNLYTGSSSSWVTTASPTAPTTSELTKIAAVKISATISLNGYSRTLVSLVRLRNSPPNVN